MNWKELRASGEWGSMGTYTVDDVARVAAKAACQLVEFGSAELDYIPGNATRYHAFVVSTGVDLLMVAMPAWRTSGLLPRHMYLHPNYVNEKLGGTIADGAVLAELFMAIGEAMDAATEPV